MPAARSLTACARRARRCARCRKRRRRARSACASPTPCRVARRTARRCCAGRPPRARSRRVVVAVVVGASLYSGGGSSSSQETAKSQRNSGPARFSAARQPPADDACERRQRRHAGADTDAADQSRRTPAELAPSTGEIAPPEAAAAIARASSEAGADAAGSLGIRRDRRRRSRATPPDAVATAAVQIQAAAADCARRRREQFDGYCIVIEIIGGRSRADRGRHRHPLVETQRREVIMRRRKVVAIAGLGALLVLSLAAAACGDETTTRRDRANQSMTGISVNGEGKVSGKPDIANLSLGVSAEAGTVQEARDQAATSLDAMIKSLKANGVDGEGHPDAAAQHPAAVRLQQRQPEAARLPGDEHRQRQAARHQQDRQGRRRRGDRGRQQHHDPEPRRSRSTTRPTCRSRRARQRSPTRRRGRRRWPRRRASASARRLSISETSYSPVPYYAGGRRELSARDAAPDTPIQPGELDVIDQRLGHLEHQVADSCNHRSRISGRARLRAPVASSATATGSTYPPEPLTFATMDHQYRARACYGAIQARWLLSRSKTTTMCSAWPAAPAPTS